MRNDTTFQVQVGDIIQDGNPRGKGRQLEITATFEDHVMARVRVTGRTVEIGKHRLRPGSHGYSLVRSVSAGSELDESEPAAAQ